MRNTDTANCDDDKHNIDGDDGEWRQMITTDDDDDDGGEV